MTGSALFRFTLLAAIWGASFLFMRILAPEVGGVWTAQSRLTIGALALFAFVWLRKIPLQMHQWRHYLIAGVLNCAIPFAMYGVAGTILPAGYSAVLNSSVPLWATVFAAMMLGDKITPLRMLALLLGVLGVILVARPSADVPMTNLFFVGVGACLIATACYGMTVIYLKKYTSGLNPQALATLSQAFGALVLLPIGLIQGVPTHISAPALWSGLALGVLCSGWAFFLYYRLLDELGAIMASSVTFFIPLFGILWGAVFLHERLDWNVFAGCVLIIGGAVLLYRSNLKKVVS